MQSLFQVLPWFKILPFQNVILPVRIHLGTSSKQASNLLSEVEIFAAVAKAESGKSRVNQPWSYQELFPIVGNYSTMLKGFEDG